jgi:hypothetical protein
MRLLLETVFVISLAAQTGNAIAYTCNDNHYVNSDDHLVDPKFV